MSKAHVYVSVSGGIAEYQVIEGDVEVHLIDWDAFQDVDLVEEAHDAFVEAIAEYRSFPPGRAKKGLKFEIMEILSRRSDQKRWDRQSDRQHREQELEKARAILRQAGEL